MTGAQNVESAFRFGRPAGYCNNLLGVFFHFAAIPFPLSRITSYENYIFSAFDKSKMYPFFPSE